MENLGPLWAVSCFHFEDMNGCILKNIHGSVNIMSQVASSVSIVQGMSRLKCELLDNSSCSHPLFLSLMSKWESKCNNLTLIADNIYAVGATHDRKLSPDQYAALCKFLNYACSETDFKFYSRVKYSWGVVCSKSYTRAFTKDNSLVTLMNGCNGVVHFFVQHSPSVCCCTDVCNCEVRNLAIMDELGVDSTSSLTTRKLQHIRHLKKTNKVIVADVTDIARKSFYFDSENFQCSVNFPNIWERN